MENILNKINFHEAEFFYKSPDAFVDYSNMQSFSLIKSAVDVFLYYGIIDFTSEDICAFFEELQLVTQKHHKAFIPSPKKVRGVLECYLSSGHESLMLHNNVFHINRWAGSGYGFEIEAAKQKGKLK